MRHQRGFDCTGLAPDGRAAVLETELPAAGARFVGVSLDDHRLAEA